jgi:hypothetical protein
MNESALRYLINTETIRVVAVEEVDPIQVGVNALGGMQTVEEARVNTAVKGLIFPT